MVTEQFLTHEDKLESLLALKGKLTADIVRLLSVLEINEDTFSITEYEPTRDGHDLSRIVLEDTLYRHCQLAKSIDNKIKEL